VLSRKQVRDIIAKTCARNGSENEKWYKEYWPHANEIIKDLEEKGIKIYDE
jgi:hypothetical protein